MIEMKIIKRFFGFRDLKSDDGSQLITSLKQQITSSKQQITSLKQQITSLKQQNNQLSTDLQNIQIELNITRLEQNGDIQKLSDIVTQNRRDSRSYLAEQALVRLGYQCIYHEEKFHYEENEVEEEVEGWDCGGFCDSADANGNCWNPYCGAGSYIRTYTEDVKVIDSPAYVEVVKCSDPK